MFKKDKIPSIAPLNYKYPSLSAEDVPDKCRLFPITFRNEEIKHFEVLFFHRLMKKNYGRPSDAEYEVVPTKKAGVMGGVGKEWKYYIRTPSGGIIQIGTETLHKVLKLSYVLPENIAEPNERLIKEGEKLVADLLVEATRLKGQILNPQKEFEEGEGIRLYVLENVFKFYYGSAELMLEYADDNEEEIYAEYKRFLDEFLPDVYKQEQDLENVANLDKYFVGLGMYYRAAILYYFMAFEGLINLLYHAFLKDGLEKQNLEQRLDLELKILLMPALCNGFKGGFLESKSDIFKNFKELKNYRNEIFHSKIADSLKNVAFVEDGFFYTVEMERSKRILPSRGKELEKEDVLKVKSIVDHMIEEILDKMDDESKELVNKHIMKELAIPFWKDATGKIRFGTLGREG